MRLIKDLQRRRLIVVALTFACIMAAGIAFWQVSKLPVEAASGATSSQDKQYLQARLQKGVGSEVQFAADSAETKQIAEAVGSTADFIRQRSGLTMSEGMLQKLAEAESNVLKGNVQRLSIEELTDNMTAAVMDRLATVTDREIRETAESSSDEYGQIMSRANGKWGAFTQEELIEQAMSGRDWSGRGAFALRTETRSMIEEEVNDRVNTLSAALPKQFGQAREKGITPMQALLIAYSVAADDPLTDSRSDITAMLLEQRMNAGQTREQRKAQKNVSGRPYGPHGLLHPSNPYLFFNKDGIYRLLNLSDEGGKN